MTEKKKKIQTKEERAFQTKEVKKVQQNFRSHLKKEKMSVRFVDKTNNYSQFDDQEKLDIRLTTGFSEINFYITRVTKHIMTLKLGYANMDYKPDFIVKFAEDLAKTIQSSALIVQGKESLMGIERLKELPELNTENMRWMFITSYTAGEVTCYINIEDDYVENKIVVSQFVNEELQKYAENDKTFTYKEKHRNKDYLIINYYYKGFEGEFEIYFGEKMEFQMEELNIKKEINSPKEIVSILKETMEESHNHVKLVSLINPPKKHFKSFILKNISKFGGMDEIVTKVFDLISEEVSPEQIEEDVATGNHSYHMYNKQNEFHFFTVFNVYLVLNTRTNSVEKLYDFDKAKKLYKEKVLQKEHEEYLARIQNIEQTIDALKEN